MSERVCVGACGVCVCAALSDLILEMLSFGEALSHLDFQMCTVGPSLPLSLSLSLSSDLGRFCSPRHSLA